MELWVANININKKHPIQEIKSQLKINEENNCYTSYEYEGTIVVKTNNPNIKKVFMSHQNIKSKAERVPLNFDVKLNVWFDKRDEERHPVGINQCGTFFFEAENKEGYIIDRTRDIHVSSKLLSEKEFLQMKDEIANIIEELAISTNGPTNIFRHRQEQINRIKENYRKIKALKEILLDIENNPHFELTLQNKLLHYSKIKRININALIEKNYIHLRINLWLKKTCPQQK